MGALFWIASIYGGISLGLALDCWSDLETRDEEDESPLPLLDRMAVDAIGVLICAANGLIWPYHIGWLVFQWMKRDR